MRNMLKTQRDEGRTIVLASHNHEDIAALCDEVFHIDAGVMSKNTLKLHYLREMSVWYKVRSHSHDAFRESKPCTDMSVKTILIINSEERETS